MLDHQDIYDGKGRCKECAKDENISTSIYAGVEDISIIRYGLSIYRASQNKIGSMKHLMGPNRIST